MCTKMKSKKLKKNQSNVRPIKKQNASIKIRHSNIYLQNKMLSNFELNKNKL